MRAWMPGLLAGLAFGALMFSFLHVVQQGVARAEQGRAQAAERTRAELACQSEGGYGQRQACLAALGTLSARPSLARL